MATILNQTQAHNTHRLTFPKHNVDQLSGRALGDYVHL